MVANLPKGSELKVSQTPARYQLRLQVVCFLFTRVSRNEENGNFLVHV